MTRLNNKYSPLRMCKIRKLRTGGRSAEWIAGWNQSVPLCNRSLSPGRPCNPSSSRRQWDPHRDFWRGCLRAGGGARHPDQLGQDSATLFSLETPNPFRPQVLCTIAIAECLKNMWKCQGTKFHLRAYSRLTFVLQLFGLLCRQCQFVDVIL